MQIMPPIPMLFNVDNMPKNFLVNENNMPKIMLVNALNEPQNALAPMGFQIVVNYSLR